MTSLFVVVDLKSDKNDLNLKFKKILKSFSMMFNSKWRNTRYTCIYNEMRFLNVSGLSIK